MKDRHVLIFLKFFVLAISAVMTALGTAVILWTPTPAPGYLLIFGGLLGAKGMWRTPW